MQDFLRKIEKKEDCKVGVSAASFCYDTSQKITFTENYHFPAASIIKLFVAAATLQKVEKKGWNLSKEIIIEKEEKRQKSSVIAETGLKKISLKDILYFLLAHSDNLAQNILEKIISEKEINDFIQNEGFSNTKFVSLQNTNKETFSLTTPKESCIFLKKLWKKELINDTFSNLLLKNLSKTKETYFGLRYLPCKLNVAKPTIEKFYSKTGRLENTINSCTILKEKEHTIIISVFITSLEIPQFRNNVDNKGILLSSEITKAIFDKLNRR